MAARSVNKVTLMGNLGKDPDVKFTPSGVPMAKFSIATNERYKDRSGEWQDRTEWHSVVAWQRTAEIVGEYAKKGSRVYIEGRLHTSSWEDKQSGEKKYRTEIVVNDLVLLSSRDEGSATNGHHASRTNGHFDNRKSRDPFDQRGSNNFTDEAPEPGGITDEDIPF